jgi:hypothetical protein
MELLLFLLLALAVAAGIVLAVIVVKWLFIIAVVAGLIGVILFFARRVA